MSTAPILALADFLDQRALAVKAIEAEAEAILHETGDQAGYAAKMRGKAELLAALAEDGDGLVTALEQADPALGEAAGQRLEAFSGSAATSLRVGSVFFMSALLYNDDHQPGQPNNLELFAREVRAWA